jgi:hypothetical protein
MDRSILQLLESESATCAQIVSGWNILKLRCLVDRVIQPFCLAWGTLGLRGAGAIIVSFLDLLRRPDAIPNNPQKQMQDKEYTTSPSLVGHGIAIPENRRRISWGAIFAGTLVAISVQLLLTLLGISIGAWVIDPAAGTQGMQGIGMGAGIWALVSFLIALFIGGWVAGRMAGVGNKLDGLLEGTIVWSAVTVLTFMLVTTTVGRVVGGAAGLAGNTLTTAGERIQNPQMVARDLEMTVRDMAEDQELRRDTEQTLKDVGEDVARATATGSFWAFLALLLGAIVAAIGGRLGRTSGLDDSRVVENAPVIR